MEIYNLIDLPKKLVADIDVFICCSSFEDRCKTIPIRIASNSPKSSIIFYNGDFNSQLIKNAAELKSILNPDKSEICELSLIDSAFSYSRIFEKFKFVIPQKWVKKIVIDVTTFTHESLLIILKILLMMKSENQKISFLYNGAEEYSVNEKKPELKWLTKGIKYSRSIIGYPGITDLNLIDHLIILFGFEKDRTKRIIDNFNYNKITLAFGEEKNSIKQNHYELNIARHNDLVNSYPNIQKLEISLTYPILTKKQILSYVNEINENIVIIPMNNKLSTLGAGLAAIQDKRIQLYYSLAARYNTEGYSEPSLQVYHFEYSS